MTNEILRFVNVRKAVVTNNPVAGVGPILLVDHDNPSTLFTDLLNLKKAGAGRNQFEQTMQKYLSSDLYALGRKPLPLNVARFDESFGKMGSKIKRDAIEEVIQSAFDMSLEALLGSSAYAESMQRLRDTVLAQSITINAKAEVATAARWLRLLDWLAAVPALTRKSQLLERILLLPEQIFPLPSTKNPQDAINNEANEKRKQDYEAAINNASRIQFRSATPDGDFV